MKLGLSLAKLPKIVAYLSLLRCSHALHSDQNQALKVHNHVMKVKEYETYLGDMICETGSKLCQAQFKLELAMPTFWVSCLAKLTSKLPYFILGQCYNCFNARFADFQLFTSQDEQAGGVVGAGLMEIRANSAFKLSLT